MKKVLKAEGDKIRTIHVKEPTLEKMKGVTKPEEKWVTTEVKPPDEKADAHVKNRELWLHVQNLHTRMDKTEDLMKAIYNKLEYVQANMKRVEDLAVGKDPDFENEFRKVQTSQVLVTEKMRDQYGDEAPKEVDSIVATVLGRDVLAFMRPNKTLPSALFTVLVPKRLSGLENDFRSVTVYNSSVEDDVKKWCERVKSNLFKTYATQSKGVPVFLLSKSS